MQWGYPPSWTAEVGEGNMSPLDWLEETWTAKERAKGERRRRGQWLETLITMSQSSISCPELGPEVVEVLAQGCCQQHL